MRVDTGDGQQIEVRIHGNGGMPVLFVHGWMVSGAVWNDLLEVLQPQRQRFLVPDHRGTGASSRPASGYTLARYADDMIAVADAAGARRFAIVGHSMGGQLAQMIAARHPDRVAGAVLLSPVPASGLAGGMPPEVVELFSTCAANRDKQRAILGAACKDLPDAARERLLDDAGTTAEGAIREGFASFHAGGFAGELGAITAPVLCVATDDPFLPVPFLQQTVVDPIRRGRLVHLPGPGHYLANERPRETGAVVGAFLAGLDEGDG